VYATCESRFVALDESEGRERCRLPNVDTQASDFASPSALMLRNEEFIFSRTQRLFAADRDGNTLWTYPSDPNSTAYLLGPGVGDMIYVRNSSSDLVALDSRGQEMWTFNGGPSVAFNENPVTAAGGTLYVAAAHGPLFALTSGGTLKWVFNLPPSTMNLGYTSPLLSSDGVIYQVLENSVIALSSNRELIWQLELPEKGHRGFPALAPDGTLYAVMDNSVVHAIQTRN